MTKLTNPWRVEARYWHPVAAQSELQQDPIGVTLLEQPLVLWRDQSGVVHAWLDRCPHRGARLSLGIVVNDQLQCAYHGWRFDGSARCAHVPAVPDFVASDHHSATPFEAQIRYGLVWVRLDSSEAHHSEVNLSRNTAIAAFAAESDEALRKVNCGPYTVATSAPRLIENFLDMAHFSYVHEGWLGDQAHAQVHRYEIHEENGSLKATGCKAWQPQSNRHATQGAWVDYTYTLNHPYSAVLTKVPEAQFSTLPQYRESIAVFVVPVSPTECKVWFRLAVADTVSTDEQLQAFQNTIFLQDQPVLESQVPKCLPLWSGLEAHVASDRLSIAYRRWLLAKGIAFGVQVQSP
jgi:phenylpropionate dioxygenase-like ring-hydroxylating dioxygenase large terminal subunit